MAVIAAEFIYTACDIHISFAILSHFIQLPSAKPLHGLYTICRFCFTKRCTGNGIKANSKAKNFLQIEEKVKRWEIGKTCLTRIWLKYQIVKPTQVESNYFCRGH